MGKEVKRTTICLELTLHKALRSKAAEASCSISELVNKAVQFFIAEQEEDFLVFQESKSEAQISYDKMVKQLKKDGFIPIKEQT